MRILSITIFLVLVSVSCAWDVPGEHAPLLVVLNKESSVDFNRLLHVSGCEFIRQKIEFLRTIIEQNKEDKNEEFEGELRYWEGALSELKKAGKPWHGDYTVSISEDGDYFVVAYFASENNTANAFVCMLSKKDYAVAEPSVSTCKNAYMLYKYIKVLKQTP